MRTTFLSIVLYRVIAILVVGVLFFITNHYYVPSYNLAVSFVKLKIGFITGFLTISSFLLSIEGIVLTKAFEIFNNKDYIAYFKRQKIINPKLKDVDLLDPLDNSNNLISATILCSLCTSAFHIVLAFFEQQEIIIALCFGFTSVTFYSVVKVVFIMKNIYTRWINNMRNDRQDDNQ